MSPSDCERILRPGERRRDTSINSPEILRSEQRRLNHRTTAKRVGPIILFADFVDLDFMVPRLLSRKLRPMTLDQTAYRCPCPFCSDWYAASASVQLVWTRNGAMSRTAMRGRFGSAIGMIVAGGCVQIPASSFVPQPKWLRFQTSACPSPPAIFVAPCPVGSIYNRPLGTPAARTRTQNSTQRSGLAACRT